MVTGDGVLKQTIGTDSDEPVSLGPSSEALNPLTNYIMHAKIVNARSDLYSKAA